MSIDELKDIILAISGLVVPISVAIINIKQNKKTKKEIENELYKIKSENYIKHCDEYNQMVGIKRLVNVSDAEILANNILNYLNTHPNMSIEELKNINDKIIKIDLPSAESELYPCEIPALLKVEELKRNITYRINKLSNN